MLLARKLELEARMRARMMELRLRELSWMVRNANQLASLAALLAGFAHSGLVFTKFVSSDRYDLCAHAMMCAEFTYPLIIVVTIGVSLLTLWRSMLVTMLAPKVALHGDMKSMTKCIAMLRREVRGLSLLLACAFCSFGLCSLLLFCTSQYAHVTYLLAAFTSAFFVVLAIIGKHVIAQYRLPDEAVVASGFFPSLASGRSSYRPLSEDSDRRWDRSPEKWTALADMQGASLAQASHPAIDDALMQGGSEQRALHLSSPATLPAASAAAADESAEQNVENERRDSDELLLPACTLPQLLEGASADLTRRRGNDRLRDLEAGFADSSLNSTADLSQKPPPAAPTPPPSESSWRASNMCPSKSRGHMQLSALWLELHQTLSCAAAEEAATTAGSVSGCSSADAPPRLPVRLAAEAVPSTSVAGSGAGGKGARQVAEVAAPAVIPVRAPQPQCASALSAVSCATQWTRGGGGAGAGGAATSAQSSSCAAPAMGASQPPSLDRAKAQPCTSLACEPNLLHGGLPTGVGSGSVVGAEDEEPGAADAAPGHQLQLAVGDSGGGRVALLAPLATQAYPATAETKSRRTLRPIGPLGGEKLVLENLLRTPTEPGSHSASENR